MVKRKIIISKEGFMLSFLTSKPVFEESNKKLREVGHRVGGHTDEREVQKGVSA